MPEVVMILFGPQFTGGALTLCTLASDQFVNVCTGSVGYILMMCGYERLMRNTITLTALLSVCLNVMLVPKHGIVEAAFATSISLAFMNVVCTFLVWSRFHILPLPIPLKLGLNKSGK